MFEITTDITIDAPHAAVWQVLLDFGRHPEWNPFIQAIEGRAEVGARLSVRVCPPGGRAMRFKPQVTGLQPGQELRWRGRFLLPGLFDGEHCFKLVPAGPGCTRLVHGEVFSGLLVGLSKASLVRQVQPGFEAMNRALKARVEARP